eukprot:CAMPEP_0201895706 /NCGR_PEP_ID=MMETSP0902-20130614/43180_1 /ASSEMBLY_ACC=CAM_ASM_000551 /TAXON_ID=420261 /ORGANISM="Thalassiosira antarctica, Strain CCMP982" /LENGTH=472 /DNA_ID=CAMNT_0048428103 /DNA_START=164 /DNA_END=1578 /DNA_ORIENTATION=-
MQQDAGQTNDATTALLSSRSIRHRHFVPILVGVAVMVGLVSGSLYGFGRYSLALKEQLEIGQLQVQRFGILLDSGNYIGHPLAGYVYDHYGPRVSCVGAAMVVFCGYGAIALALFHGNGNMISLALCNVGFFSVGFGSGLGYIAGLGSVTKEFLGRPTLGRAVASVAAGYGLSSTLVGITFHRIPSLHGFFLFWAVLVAMVNLIGAIIFAREEEEEEEQEIHDITDTNAMSNIENNNEDENRSTLSTSMDDENPREHLIQQQQFPYRPWAFSTRLQAWTTWQRLDFWILFGAFACVTGCGLFIINNISTMVQSIGQADSLAGNLLFLLSICNVAGRIIMGSLADVPGVNKIGLFQGVAIIMFFGLLVSAVSPFQEGDHRQLICLTITIASVATAYGGSWVLIVGILADLYGREDFGKDYGLIAMGPAVSGLLFNSVSALIYENHAEDHGNEDGACFGNDCYRSSYWMTAAAA